MNRDPDNMVSGELSGFYRTLACPSSLLHVTFALTSTETHTEIMERFDELDELFRDFYADETRGDEKLVADYERQILAAKKVVKNRTIYSA